jgi:hypothetical protein
LKWLSFDDKEGNLREFSLLTKTYRIRFISTGLLEDEKLVRKRFAIVGNPSEPLLEVLSERGVKFETFKTPSVAKEKPQEDEFLTRFSQDVPEKPSEFDELDLININLIKYSAPTTIKISEFDLHGLCNILLSSCVPYLKQVKLVSSYSFTNSVHRTANISHNGKVNMLAADDVKEERQWFGVELEGVYTFESMKKLIGVFEGRVREGVVKIVGVTAKASESMNWVEERCKTVYGLSVEVEREGEKRRYGIKYAKGS